jgi:hypothetical protein
MLAALFSGNGEEGAIVIERVTVYDVIIEWALGTRR